MKLAVAVHQVGTSYLKSQLGPSDEPSTTDQHDEALDVIGTIYGKVFDGLNFMSTFDPHGRAISGLPVVQGREQEHAASGREWVPWGVPHGRDPELEGKLAAQVAVAGAGPGEAATCILNIEPYPLFWELRGAASDAAIHKLLEQFVASGGQEIWLWVDARAWQLRDINFAHWVDWQSPDLSGASVVTRVLPEVYWTDFLRGVREPTIEDARGYIDNALTLLAAHGIPANSVYPTLPGDSTSHVMVDAIRYCFKKGTGRPNIWQRLNLSRDTALAVARMDDPWGDDDSVDPPVVDLPTVSATIDRLEDVVDISLDVVSTRIREVEADVEKVLQAFNHEVRVLRDDLKLRS